MKKLALSLAVFGVLAVSASNNAHAYGMAGCGWGSYYWSYYGWTQVLASTTNSMASNQAFAISSGTSGCYKPSIRAEAEQEMFVTENFDTLAMEMAQGKGEYLESFAALMGCEKEAFSAGAKANYRSLMSENAEGLLRNVRNSANVLGCGA